MSSVQRINKSVFDAAENILVLDVSKLASVPEQEGIIFVLGFNNPFDGGAGQFVYVDTTPRSTANGTYIIDATQSGEGEGCWHRVINSKLASLAWFGSNDDSTGNLLEEYGLTGITVLITDPTNGGVFKFDKSQVVNHNGKTNINGWLRQNDRFFADNIDLGDNRITKSSRALANKDVPNLEQVHELIAGGDYVGIVPMYEPRHIGDGVTDIFSTPATHILPTPDPLLLSAESFEITINGLKLRPTTDYIINVQTANVEFTYIPQLSDEIDICWFNPIIATDYYNEAIVTASETGTTNVLADWFGINGKDIFVKGSSTTTGRTLGQWLYDHGQTWFTTISDLVNAKDQIDAGMVVGIKQSLTQGYGEYVVITKLFADSNGITYGSGTPNIEIIDADLIAWNMQINIQMIEGEEVTLTAGQTVVDFGTPVSYGYIFLSGIQVDQGRLVVDDDYSLSINDTRVTLNQSYPAGTKITLNYFQPDTTSTVDISVNGVAVGATSKLNFIGDFLAVNNEGIMDIYSPVPELDIDPFTVTPNSLTLGQPLTDIQVSWEYNLLVDDTTSPAGQTLTVNNNVVTLPSADRSYTQLATELVSNSVSLTTNHIQFGSSSITKNINVSNYIYSGTSTVTDLVGNAVTGLTNKISTNNYKRTYATVGGVDTYFYLVVPVRILANPASAQFIDAGTGWEMPMNYQGSTTVENEYGSESSENYHVYRSAYKVTTNFNVEMV